MQQFMNEKAAMSAALLLIMTACGSSQTEDQTDNTTQSENPGTNPQQGTPSATQDPGVQSTATPSSADFCSGIEYAVAPGLGEMGGIWDESNQRLVFFGGDTGQPIECESQQAYSSQTWAFYTDCNTFELLDENSGPGPRGRHSVVLNKAGGELLTFGGRTSTSEPGVYEVLNDLWAFNLESNSWREVQTQGTAPGRFSTVAGVAKGKLIVHGGNSSSQGTSYVPNAEVFTLDLETLIWSELTTNEGPGERLFHSGTISQDESTLFIYGGGNEKALIGSFFADLWALDIASGQWSELHSGRGLGEIPPGRIASGIIHDAPRNRLILWAGHDNSNLGNDNQLWAFDLRTNTWSNLREGDVFNTDEGAEFCDFPADFTTIDNASPERRYQHATTITDDGDLITFGGKTDCGIVNDVWLYDTADDQWQELSSATAGEVCLRAYAECSSLCF